MTGVTVTKGTGLAFQIINYCLAPGNYYLAPGILLLCLYHL